MTRVLVLGNASVDLIQRVERFPRPGETLLSSTLLRCPGGKGLNQAVAAVRTGALVTFTAPVGQDQQAEFLADQLKLETGLDVHWRVVGAPTDISSIWVSADGENMIVSSADCPGSVTPDRARMICADLATGDFLLMQGNLRSDTTRIAAETARARGACTVLNTAPIAWDMRQVIGSFDIVIANELEAAIVADGDFSERWPDLRARGTKTAIVTLGARGATVFDGNDRTSVAAPRVMAVDTAGAGDVMVGTLVGLLAQGHDKLAAVEIAVAAASLSVTRDGTVPSFPTRDEVRSLLAKRAAI
jgi:ribokinase